MLYKIFIFLGWIRLIKGLLLIGFILCLSSGLPVHANSIVWTEKKLGKIILKADKAARQKKWSDAIKYGEQALLGSKELDQQGPYINALKNLNLYYDKADRLQEITPRIEKTYLLSKEHFGQKHNTTSISRQLYYKLLIANKNHEQAIPLVLEDISQLEGNREDEFKRLHYLEQLYALYGITYKLEAQEKAILEYLKLSEQLLGGPDEHNIDMIEALAKNYCRQKKLDKFNELKSKYQLYLLCK